MRDHIHPYGVTYRVDKFAAKNQNQLAVKYVMGRKKVTPSFNLLHLSYMYLHIFYMYHKYLKDYFTQFSANSFTTLVIRILGSSSNTEKLISIL